MTGKRLTMNNPKLDAIFDQNRRVQPAAAKTEVLTDQDQLRLTLESGRTLEGPSPEEIQRIKKQYEDQIRRQSEQYQRVIKELDAFSYSVAHDLRAPLRAVASLVERLTELQGQNTRPDCSHTISAIKESTTRMQTLVDNLLEFSKTNGLDEDLQEVDMTALVRSVLDELLESESGASLSVFVEPLHPAVADGALMRQVWVNLLSNAMKYTRKKSSRQITISSRANANEIVYHIADNGAGFNMKYADRLFGVFQRLHCAEDFEGTGVGLAIVQRIVHKHGGRVWAEGVEENGATFYFALPTSHFSTRPTRN